MKLRLHNIIERSRSNGPGIRFGIWFQGCTLNCPGCFNPDTHDSEGGFATDINVLLRRIECLQDTIEGITISGGEPLQQSEALLEITESVKNIGLSTLVFSGYDLSEIMELPLGKEISENIDVLIAGRYLYSEKSGKYLLSSSNQKLHFLTERYTIKDFEKLPKREIILNKDGVLTITGIL